MKLEGMTDEQYQEITRAVQEIQYLIVCDGGMATKSRVEDVLMARYGLDRSDAHTILNWTESRNYQAYMVGRDGAEWKARGPVPLPEDWPEIWRAAV